MKIGLTILLLLSLTLPSAGQEFYGPKGMGGPPKGRKTALRDLVEPVGLNSHGLTGYGLVVGLPGSGDSAVSLTSSMMTQMLTRMGLQPQLDQVRNMKAKNVAVVAVTAQLPPVARSGDPLDLEVASLGDAKSLVGGILLQSLLRGPDGQVYGSGQGRISAPVDAGQKGTVVGKVLAGGTVSRNLESPALQRSTLMLRLRRPDVVTASRLAEGVGLRLAAMARAVSAEMVEIQLPAGLTPVEALARIQDLEVTTEQGVTIVVDRHSRSVVVGGHTRLLPAVITHRGITVEIGPQGTTLKKVMDSLAQSGATAEELVAILESLQQAGSLTGRIEYR